MRHEEALVRRVAPVNDAELGLRLARVRTLGHGGPLYSVSARLSSGTKQHALFTPLKPFTLTEVRSFMTRLGDVATNEACVQWAYKAINSLFDEVALDLKGECAVALSATGTLSLVLRDEGEVKHTVVVAPGCPPSDVKKVKASLFQKTKRHPRLNESRLKKLLVSLWGP